VWEKLREIPYGSTRSYGEVARAMGRPTGTSHGYTRGGSRLCDESGRIGDSLSSSGS